MAQQSFLAAIYVHALYAVGFILQVEGHNDFAVLHLFFFSQRGFVFFIELLQHILISEDSFGQHSDNIFICYTVRNLAEGQGIHIVSINAHVIFYHDGPACLLQLFLARFRHHADFPVHTLLSCRLFICIGSKSSGTAK